MKTPSSPHAPPGILIVDDTPANLQLLSDMLRQQGFRPRPVPGGEMALRAAEASPPDLILLDVNMPGLDGFETCARLKRDPKLAPIPVIFVTAFNELASKVRGFEVGAVDYITKPFQFEEVEARVRLHLELARLRIEQTRHVTQLQEAVARRTAELAAARSRLEILDRAKTDFLSLISHEIRTPLNGAFGVTELLLANSTDPAIAEYSELYAQSRQRLLALLDDAMLLSQIGDGVDTGAREQCALEDLLEEACVRAMPLAEYHHVRLSTPPAGLGLVRGSADYLVRALQGILETAIKFAGPHTMVHWNGDQDGSRTWLSMEAFGRTVPPSAQPHFFDLLAVRETILPGGDLGLGLPLAERIVRLHGGSVQVDNLSPPGIRLTVRFEAAGQPTD